PAATPAGRHRVPGLSCWIRLTRAASASSGRVVGDSEEDPDDARANTAPVRSRTTSSVSQAETLPVNACLTGRYPLCSERNASRTEVTLVGCSIEEECPAPGISWHVVLLMCSSHQRCCAGGVAES